jgi:hypothetical protein
MIDKPRNIFDAIRIYQHDEDYMPYAIPEPTAARTGSVEKVLVFCERLRLGQDLYHPGDEVIAADMEQQMELIRYVQEHAREVKKHAKACPQRGR